MDNDNLIIGIGEILWDLLPEGRKPGGAPANFAFHAAQFGFDARIVSAVGDDPLGEELCEIYRQKQLPTHIERVGFPTGTVRVTLEGNGIPRYEITEGVAWDNIPFTAELDALAQRTRAVCFGTLAQRSPVSRASILRFLDAMPRGENRYRIYDINLRQHFYGLRTIEESLGRCDILKINDEELKVLASMFPLPAEADAACRRLIDRFALRILVLTCGTDGSRVFTDDGTESFLETPRVTVADTVGAGDSFTAAFTAALLRGRTIREAHRLAVDVSAYVCTRAGAMPELPAPLLGR